LMRPAYPGMRSTVTSGTLYRHGHHSGVRNGNEPNGSTSRDASQPTASDILISRAS
jgi:hypothetical protein